MNRTRPVVLSLSVTSLVSAAAWAVVTAPVLDQYATSLTSYLATSKTLVQDLRPRHDQRGVDLDGMLRSQAPMGWSINGDSLGGGYALGRKLGDVALWTGTYAPLDVDLSLPTLGLPVVIGRTYNNRQENSTPARYDSDGPQGWNWGQVAMPEIRLYTGPSSGDDVIYLVYGADRYIEFGEVSESTNHFKAKNGAAGVIDFFEDEILPDTYTYYDQRGNKMVFFGFDSASGVAKGQLWTMTDPAGNVAYVGHTSTPSTAISSGYDGSGRITTFYDASNHRYSFAYSTFGGSTRLSQVKAEIQSGGSWTSPVLVGQVDYDYYTTTGTDKGLAGDLRLVTITSPVPGSSDLVRSKYYRYYTGTWTNSDGQRGDPHAVKMVVGFDGCRQYDMIDSTFDLDYYTETDANLKPYAEGYFEYVSTSDRRISKALFNGSCGCSGGTSGVFTLSYGAVSGGTFTLSNYEQGWATRTVVAQPDEVFLTHYFDEVGQVQGQVRTSSDPASSPAKTWVDWVLRNTSGQVEKVYSPASNTAYTHSTGAVTFSSSVGLVTSYTLTSSGNLTGLRTATAVQEGTSGSPTTVSSQTLSERQLEFSTYTGVSLPYLATTSTYPSGSALTTTITTTFWSGTNSSVLYLAPKIVQVAAPAVTSGNNGSGSATSRYQYLRQDGSVAYTKDADGTLMYSGRSIYGQTARTVSDYSTSTSDYLSGDVPSGWSLSSSGTPIHILKDMTYDDQGRPASITQPSVNGTRTSAWVYLTLADRRFASMAFPRKVSTTYYGPIAYAVMNHAGKTERTATIAVSSSGVTSLPGTTPSGSTWSAMVDRVYDLSGNRQDETWTYTSTSTKDIAKTGYDSMGRIWRSEDAPGTIRRTVFDERGLPIASWMGTNDNSFSGGSASGTDNMTKIEAREYDNNSSTGGGNGLLTKVTRDPDGNWGTTTDQRVTTFIYDYRNRAIVQVNPLSPHIVNQYDNSNRSIAVGQYSSSSGLSASTDPTSTSTNRIGLNATAYDERGQVYLTTRYEINQSTGATGSSLTVKNWYDDDGRLVKVQGPRITKTAYDRLGRSVSQYVISHTSDSTTYANVLTLTSDTVLEETHTGRDPLTGLTAIQYTLVREHDRTGTGKLDADGDSDLLQLRSTDLGGRAQITCMWYDDWDRVSDTVNYGTNGGSTLNRSGLSIPSRSDTALRTTTVYDDFGRVYQSFDPVGLTGIQTRTLYDFAGRRVEVYDNYVDGTPGGGSYNDEDRLVVYDYTDGLLSGMIRKMPSSGDDQFTYYSYGTVKGSGSQISTGHLPHETLLDEQYTSQGAGDRTQTTEYNALSEVLTTQDPGGNIITTSYDLAGRPTLREVTTLSAPFDGRVRKLETDYDNRGMMSGARSKSSGGTILEEQEFTYDGWGMMDAMTQDPDSAISGGSGRASFGFTFTYAAETTADYWQKLYLSASTYPGSVTVTPVYNSTTIDLRTHRASALFNAGLTDQYAAYEYMGANTVAGVWESAAYSYVGDLSASPVYSTYSSYMDNFNRPIKTKWIKYLTGSGDPAFVDLAMTPDRVGNIADLTDAVLMDASSNRTFDQLSTFDNLRRIAKRDEGKLASGSISPASRKEESIRGVSGQIVSAKADLNADGDWVDFVLYSAKFPKSKDGGELSDARSTNRRNELRSRSVIDDANPSTPRPVTLDYDFNGNLIDDGETYTYVFDAFNRLVQVISSGSGTPVVANYTYNALGQRISEQYDCNNSVGGGVTDDVTDSYDPIFYIANDRMGRRVATFRDSDLYAKETFVYHAEGASGPDFAGGVCLRDRDAQLSDPTKLATTSAASSRAERYFYCADAKGSVMALVTSGDALGEQYRYSPTGVPYGIPLGDMDSDGEVKSNTGEVDLTIVSNATYQVRKDVNLDGVRDAADVAIVTARDNDSTGRGRLSSSSLDSHIGVLGKTYERWDCCVFGDLVDALDARLNIAISGVTTHTSTNNVTIDNAGRGGLSFASSTSRSSGLSPVKPRLVDHPHALDCSGNCEVSTATYIITNVVVTPISTSCGGGVDIRDYNEIILPELSPNREPIDSCTVANGPTCYCDKLHNRQLVDDTGVMSPHFKKWSRYVTGCEYEITYNMRVMTYKSEGTCNTRVVVSTQDQ